MTCMSRTVECSFAVPLLGIPSQPQFVCRHSSACAPCGSLPNRAARWRGHSQRRVHGHDALVRRRNNQNGPRWSSGKPTGFSFTLARCSADAHGAPPSEGSGASAPQPPPAKLPRSQARAMATLLDLLKHLLQFIQQPNGGASGAMMSTAATVMLDRIESVTNEIDPGDNPDVGQTLFECRRFLQLIRLDLKMLAVAKKPETLATRLTDLGKKCETALNLCKSIA
eukprot:jgi/Mesvir1/16854/Mv15741-RA.1